MPRLQNSMQTLQASIGPARQHKRRHSCAAAWGCAINFFARRIKKRCDTSVAARRFNSSFEIGAASRKDVLQSVSEAMIAARLGQTPQKIPPSTYSIGIFPHIRVECSL